MKNEVKFGWNVNGCNLMSLQNFRDGEPPLVKTIVEKKHAINLLPVLINASKEMEKERVGNERGGGSGETGVDERANGVGAMICRILIK